MFELTRPLLSIDLETTGINATKDRIIQIGTVRLNPDGTQREWQTLVNPTVPIAKEATEVHKITDDMVRDQPTFSQLAPTLLRGFENVDFCGYNCKAFDLPFLVAEFERAGHKFDLSQHHVVDGFKIFLAKHPRNLTAAVKEFLNEEFGDAHDALADARASLRVVIEQLRRHDDIPRTPAGIHDYLFAPKGNNVDSEGKFYFENGEVIMNFGKYRGQILRMVPPDYLKWICSANFSPETKKICRDAMDGKYPQPRS